MSRLAADPAAQPAQTAHVVNIANGLTLLRLLLVPVFLVLLFWHGGHSPGWRIWACVAFATATITDLIDGDIARSRGLVTDVGKVADPIADKALTGAALVGLSALDDLSWIVTIVILARELGVTGLRFFVIRHGVIPASRGGKIKTLLQNIAIGCYLLPFTGWAATGRYWVLFVAVVITVVTGVDYVARALRLRRTSERAAMKRARKLAQHQ
ncbi:MAG TPA: CDP-diacylglycerol--glycerol-3-phosphate 3-phosphatidyltransferase [Mycobacteriales bacterium]|nr:CDP-diacylglycerol--glycerol-3-phosphate 3-phosphatidyltransferase [Mycobacteriales bacterium]